MIQTIQWFPGHMAKTRRMITENLSQVDVVIELLDARIPVSSKNPEIDRLIGEKPRVIVMTKASLADPEKTRRFAEYYREAAQEKKYSCDALAVDTVTGEGFRGIEPAVRRVLAEKLQRYADRGMEGRHVRAMILGIPNVGKSTLVNRLGGGKRAKVEDRPGVTKTKQWVTTNVGIELLDMPGVLWPKFDDQSVGEKLAFTGAIKDDVLDTEELAADLCALLCKVAPEQFLARYKLPQDALQITEPFRLLEAVARRRGFLVSGGELDTERAAGILLDEFRGGKIGRITLDEI